MDSLYFLSKAQFHQAATQISLYHEEASQGYRILAEDCLRTAGLNPSSYVFWNVPNMSSYFGKSVPLDVHGNHVLVDEGAAARAAMSYGVLRYALISAAVRAKEGGRWRYDFVTMNFALGVGVVSGFALLSVGRKRLAWMRRRPVGGVAASLLACLAATVAARQAIRAFGIGMVAANNSHRKAVARLNCADCFEDVGQYVAQQAEELRRQEVPRQPGMPPPPEEFVRRFEKGKKAQLGLLETDISELRAAKRRIGSHVCDVHRGLREDERFAETTVLPILPADVQLARERSSTAVVQTKAE